MSLSPLNSFADAWSLKMSLKMTVLESIIGYSVAMKNKHTFLSFIEIYSIAVLGCAVWLATKPQQPETMAATPV